MAFYFVSTFAIAQTPTKQPALRLSRTKNLHFAKATFPGFSANEFAGNLLIPDNFLNQIDTEQLLRLQAQEYDSFLADYRKLWCVSNRAILVRLLISEKISQYHYQKYVDYKEDKLRRESTQVSSKSIPRTYRHREPVNVFGKPFVYAVFDSLHNKKITLSKASTYLDNLKISDVRQLEQYV